MSSETSFCKWIGVFPLFIHFEFFFFLPTSNWWEKKNVERHISKRDVRHPFASRNIQLLHVAKAFILFWWGPWQMSNSVKFINRFLHQFNCCRFDPLWRHANLCNGQFRLCLRILCTALSSFQYSAAACTFLIHKFMLWSDWCLEVENRFGYRFYFGHCFIWWYLFVLSFSLVLGQLFFRFWNLFMYKRNAEI